MDDQVGHKIGDLVTDVCSSIESLKAQVGALNGQVDGIFPASIKALSDRVAALENGLKELQAHHEHNDGPGLEFRL